jgi:hypothetical protein
VDSSGTLAIASASAGLVTLAFGASHEPGRRHWIPRSRRRIRTPGVTDGRKESWWSVSRFNEPAAFVSTLSHSYVWRAAAEWLGVEPQVAPPSERVSSRQLEKPETASPISFAPMSRKS